jgi:hypothetical protein
MALGLAVAGWMEDGTSTAFVGVQLGRALGLEAASRALTCRRSPGPVAAGTPSVLVSDR